MKVLPIFLNNLEGRRCVVVGGDHEAERKATDLLACDAPVTLIAPEVTPALQQLADDGALTWVRRDYQEGDLKDTFLVIISETNPARTQPMWEEAQREKVLINAMDDVPHCTFVAGSVIRRGPLVVSISTSGAAPALSVRLRQQLSDTFGPEYEHFLHWAKALREPMAATYPDVRTRKELWYELVDSKVLDLLRSGDVDAAYQTLAGIVGDEVAQAVLDVHVDAPLPHADAT